MVRFQLLSVPGVKFIVHNTWDGSFEANQTLESDCSPSFAEREYPEPVESNTCIEGAYEEIFDKSWF